MSDVTSTGTKERLESEGKPGSQVPECNKAREAFKWTLASRVVYSVSKFFLWLTVKVLFRARYEGTENLPKTGPVLLAPNHASYIDPPLVGAGIPRRITFLAKEELFRGLLGWWIRTVGGKPVFRGKGDVGVFRIAEKAFQNGEVLLLFPEGTRTHDGRLQPMRDGIGLIVKRTGVPLVPVGVMGTYDAWPRHRAFPCLKKVVVRYGKPLDFSELTSAQAGREVYREITNKLGEEIARLCQQEKEG
ncbi:MAG TPA: lysophospholipid acyltransferase family protein [bacterium]|nr:lysophospholipid acyltransferase family protein [bacterium]